MRLGDLLRGVSVSGSYDPELEIHEVRYDSRLVGPGDLFVAMPGYQTDGHKYIPAAAKAGAACILCEHAPEGLAIPCLVTPDARRALALIGANRYGRPSEAMTMIAVTGTNGKTSSTYLLKAVLERCLHARVGLIGTNQNMIGDTVIPTERTTPESYELQKLFAEMRDEKCTHVVMEVSSHALYLSRVAGVFYDVGIFTNLTQDHLDFHKTMENYCDAKAILFSQCARGVVNADDPWTPRLLKNADCSVFTYGIKSAADLSASEIELAADHIAFTAVTKNARTRVRVNIPGAFMVANTLDVLGAALQLGIPLEDAAAALAAVPHVKGRVEVVPTPERDITVLIDYAHTPDGLENVLKSVKGFARGRTIALFGCGGDRDKTKRPKMGRIAGEIADYVIVTSDNPRTEAPEAIIADILPGLEGLSTPRSVIVDRVEAIHFALGMARAGDVIVLAGKGHETYQEIKHVKHHMDEREIVADYFKNRPAKT